MLMQNGIKGFPPNSCFIPIYSHDITNLFYRVLPIYKAISFQRILYKGGRTRPWLVIVNANGDIKPYIIKLFRTAEIDTRGPVANEVVGSFLAKEFNLPVPSPALIKLDEGFRATINDVEALNVLDDRDERLKFGCEMLEGYNLMIPEAFKRAQVKRMIEIDSLFAFDNLIRNPDRKVKIKSNLIVKGKSAVLIDHELGFEIKQDTIQELRDLNWDERYYKTHLVYNYLKTSTKADKKEYFNEFEECLRRLNLNAVNPYLIQLQNNGYSIAKFKIVIEYLQEMKNNSSKFVNLLRRYL